MYDIDSTTQTLLFLYNYTSNNDAYKIKKPIMEQLKPNPSPHVLIFPFPAQGHVNSMLKLAELLCQEGFHVTFLNSDYNHERLIRYTDIHARFSQYPRLRFNTISTDGLPVDDPRSGDQLLKIFDAMCSNTRLFLNDIRPPVTCIIGDGFLEFLVEVANEFKIPIIHFITVSACCFWAQFCMPQMIQATEIPIRGYDRRDMDRLITNVTGMETFLRRRDLPSFCRVDDMTDVGRFLMLMTATQQSRRVHALILNTFEDLEEPILSQIRSHCPKTYTIGPLHLHVKTRLANASPGIRTVSSNNSLWEVDRSCIAWLDKQPSKSVIYVSFGSVSITTREQFMEFWYGLVNSKQRFLWVIRPDSIVGDDERASSPAELVDGTEGRGYIVGWAPQEEVLAHRAIGGFLTHTGWNSTLESIVAGVPMICWPYFADQQINSRFVSEVWKLGFDMKDVCDRNVIEKMVNDLMVEKREVFVKSSNMMAKLANKCVSEGGSSCLNLQRLIEDIRSLC